MSPKMPGLRRIASKGARHSAALKGRTMNRAGAPTKKPPSGSHTPKTGGFSGDTGRTGVQRHFGHAAPRQARKARAAHRRVGFARRTGPRQGPWRR